MNNFTGLILMIFGLLWYLSIKYKIIQEDTEKLYKDNQPLGNWMEIYMQHDKFYSGNTTPMSSVSDLFS